MLACCSFFTVIPAHAFTADSLDITVNENGDAVATFRFTLEGIVENAIPQSVLEEELTKGLTTSSEAPVLQSMDRSSAVLLMKKFADTSDVDTGKEYRTATMDFKKAEIALQSSALSSVVSADFSPTKIVLTFPDSYKREFSNVDVLPAVFHTVEDPAKIAALAQAKALAQAQVSPGATAIPDLRITPATKGSINVTSSPTDVKVFLDSHYAGEAPALFPDIASGTHKMEFTKDGFLPVSKNVTVNAGKTTNIMVVLTYIPPETTEPESSFPWLPLLVVIIGLIAISMGGYYYWSEKKRKEWTVVENTAAEDTGNLNSAGKDIILKDTVAPDAVVKGTVIKDSVVKGTVLKDIDAGDTGVENTRLKDAVARDTVVKVTILKDIPDKETGDEDTKNKRE
jgi:hypothetical protein